MLYLLALPFLTANPSLSSAPSPNAAAAALQGPQRIVSIGGSITEIVVALKQDHRLVARDTTSSFPESVRKLPDIGYMRKLSAEGVLSLDPDLVLALEGSGPPEAIEVLKSAGVPFVLVPSRYDVQGIRDKILAVGRALKVETAAKKLAQETERAIAKAIPPAGPKTAKKRVIFVLSTKGGRILAAGTNTSANGIIQLAGGHNPFATFEGYKQVTDEAILLADPEVIVRMKHGATPEALKKSNQVLFAHPAIASATAGKNRALVYVDGLLALGFGPRTAEAIRHLATRLNEVGGATTAP